MKYLLALFLLCQSALLLAQAGCTDPQANNYNPDATENDGSCTYDYTEYNPVLRTLLNDDLKEISGIVRHNTGLWGLNDSGNEPAIYRIDSITGAVLESKILVGATNHDWEAMTTDGTHIYVGDTGNNQHGNRTDLVIYKFPAQDLEVPGDIPQAHIQKIYFSYEDQTDFTSLPKNQTRYDCEAMVTLGDSIFLFTKDWVVYNTRIYTLPKSPAGTYQARLRDSLAVSGLVTDAAQVQDSVIVLLGNSLNGVFDHFLELLFDFKTYRPLSGNKRQIIIKHPNLGQAESITLHPDSTGFIATEGFKFGSVNKKQALFKFSSGQWLNNLPDALKSIFEKASEIKIFPNPVQTVFRVNLPDTLAQNKFLLSWYSSDGRLLQQSTWEKTHIIRVPDQLDNGLYYLHLSEDSAAWVARIQVLR